MRKREYYWSLYHDAELNQIDNLRTDQVEAIFAAIPKAMKPQWWIWRDGFEDWKPFEDFPELLISLRKTEVSTIETPPTPNQKPASNAKPQSSVKFDLDKDDEVELTLMRTGVGEDRNNFRFEAVLDVRIVVGSKTFANKTVNISLKGIQFEQPLPKGLPRYFNVEILKNEKSIPVVCSEVKNRAGGPSKRAKIEVNDHATALLAILLS